MSEEAELSPVLRNWWWVGPWRLVWIQGGSRTWQRSYRRNDLLGTFTAFGPTLLYRPLALSEFA